LAEFLLQAQIQIVEACLYVSSFWVNISLHAKVQSPRTPLGICDIVYLKKPEDMMVFVWACLLLIEWNGELIGWKESTIIHYMIG